MSRRVRISAAEARRIALAAQGFDVQRPACVPDVRHFGRALRSLHLLQLDFVNVLIPAHYLVIFSRLGEYDRQRFDDFIYKHGAFTEQLAHEASIVPVDAWPLLAYRRAAWTPSKYNPLLKLPDWRRYLAHVLEIIRECGATTASELPPIAGGKRKPGDWHRSLPRWALDFHYSRGDLAIAGRKPNFQRIYDLPERVISETHLRRSVSVEDARRELLKRAADALGIATVQDLADYYRMSPRTAAPVIAELVDAGRLNPVSVENWRAPAYISANARCPRRIGGASLLSPFDPVVWFRPRSERVFDFHYRIEIYVPAEKRRWGYYVLPFRLGEDIVARVDLKAERNKRQLLVRRAHLEENRDAADCAAALAPELRRLADWLELEQVIVQGKSTFEKCVKEAI